MQKCRYCSSPFQSRDIIASICFRGYAPILCKSCNTKHYLDFSSRTIIALGVGGGFPVFYFILNIVFHYGVLIPVIIYLLWMALLLYLTPSFVKYHIKDEKKES